MLLHCLHQTRPSGICLQARLNAGAAVLYCTAHLQQVRGDGDVRMEGNNGDECRGAGDSPGLALEKSLR